MTPAKLVLIVSAVTIRNSHRDRKGLEVDVIVERRGRKVAVEVKSAQTLYAELFRPLAALARAVDIERGVLVFGGNRGQRRSDVDVVPWGRMPAYDWLGK